MLSPCIRTILAAAACVLLAGACAAQGNARAVGRRPNVPPKWADLCADVKIVTESWNRVVAVPYIVYMPERDRVLMLVSCDYPHQAMVLWSDDRGTTWSEPKYVHTGADGKGDTGMGTSLTYLGGGRVMLAAGQHWFSSDYGETWGDPREIPPAPDGKPWNLWDPLWVDRDPKTGAVTRLIQTGYTMDHEHYTSGKGPGYSTGHIRFSGDGGRTWSAGVKVPEWTGVSEVALARAQNGDLVAACRTDIPARFQGETLDHYEGLSVSVSKDDGATWSVPQRLYDWGRHHPSLVLMPNGDLVMTYVVRKGYTDTADGFPQFGVEAVVSRDHGATWDLDHKVLLHTWAGNRKGPNAWWPSSQATSTVLLPDGFLLTAFGTGYRSRPNAQGQSAPRDVGLIQWTLRDAPLIPCRTLADAAPDSDLRNVFDPALRPPAKPVATLRLRLPGDAGPVMRRAAEIAAREIMRRAPVRVLQSGEAELTVTLGINTSLPPEAFELYSKEEGVSIRGGDDLGVLYGVGKFLRTARYGPEGVAEGGWEGTAMPQGAFRAVYAATHFNNYYEAAPAEEVGRYLEELALWGANAVIVHFPTWSLAGFDDPAAQKNLEQTRRLLRTAKAAGMKTGLVQCPNQGFTSAPQVARAVPNPDLTKRHGNMGVNCCPSTPEGEKHLLDLYARLFEEYKDIGLDYLVCWPYDEGGCGCGACAPWGAKAFPALSKQVAALGRAAFPDLKVILSTWLYDLPPSGEWEGLSALLEKDAAWLDGLMCDDHFDFPRYPLDHGVPAGLPLYNFPEISMWGRSPWGGYGANPLPARYEGLWRQTWGKLDGGMPYSEGIFEDMNKAVCFRFYWDRDALAEATLREYVSYEFSPAVADDVLAAVRLLEEAWQERGPKSVEAFELLKKADAALPQWAREGWRWRILYLRGLIDSELARNGGKMEGDTLRAAFNELTDIYHAADALPSVRPRVLP
ncbi:MAG TPA: sialidase family protein [Candidatus Hydrogenedentes bacterium]|nr:sialidase family protein [Candidatus Hydrogenedentota bacterium]